MNVTVWDDKWLGHISDDWETTGRAICKLLPELSDEAGLSSNLTKFLHTFTSENHTVTYYNSIYFSTHTNGSSRPLAHQWHTHPSGQVIVWHNIYGKKLEVQDDIDNSSILLSTDERRNDVVIHFPVRRMHRGQTPNRALCASGPNQRCASVAHTFTLTQM